MYHCNECGYSSDGDSGFCIRCGSTKIVNFEQPVLPEGFEVVNTPNGLVAANMGVIKRVPIALFLAFVPGLFDIFGLGQIAMKKYLHGLVFLAASAVCVAIRFYGFLPQVYEYLPIIGIVLFVIQLVDLYKIIVKAVNPNRK